MEMQAYAGGELPEMLGPLRAFVLAHVTPFAVADAAIINDDDRLLLSRRADNGLWAMPGGGLDVGETAAEGAARRRARCHPKSKGRQKPGISGHRRSREGRTLIILVSIDLDRCGQPAPGVSVRQTGAHHSRQHP